MPNSDNSYSGTVPMVSVDDAVDIAELCMLAGSPDRIAEFLGSRLTPGEVKNRLTEAAAAPATTKTTTPRSIFGEPTAAERDALAVALQRRFEQVYPKRAP